MASATMSARSALSSVTSSSTAARRGGIALPALPSRGLIISSAKRSNASSKRRSLGPVAALATDNKPAVVKVSHLL